ncbi:hypothetical protein LZ480_09560 [Solibacillus sp. MA9]|uniref:Uncharacterized protein n=1 Tax=Solibacillus palustris TaxID=2908203 RepID=A0ABS9UCS6_9BACL|nr:hypothetical protein [Solibacillus sp. MA9]MCH7322136.1 hypothetical protein [Solibacillus sp. MA9]
MKKLLGVMLICLSIIIGFSSVVNIFPNMIALLLVLGCISIPLYLFGHLLRTSRYLMKVNWIRWMSAYVFVIIIIPTLFYTLINYEQLKLLYFNSEQYILFESASEHNLKGLSLGFIMILLLLISIRFFNDDIKHMWLINIFICMTILVYVGYQYIMWDDYRGIHETEGLVKHKWTGDRYSILWTELDKITVTPYIKYASITNTSDDTHI